MIKVIMKNFQFTFCFFLIQNNSNAGNWGKGELKLDKPTLEHFISYLYGAGERHKNSDEIKKLYPMVFSVAESGDWSFYYYCPSPIGCVNNSTEIKAIKKCEKESRGSKCKPLQ